MNLSDILADLAIERQLDLNRYVGSLQNDMGKLMADLAADIEGQLTGNLSEWKKSRLNKALAEIRLLAKEYFGVALDELQGQFIEFAQDEAEWLVGSTNKAVGGTLLTAVASKNVLEQLAKSDILFGSPLGEWMKGLEDSTVRNVSQALRLGIAAGENNQKIMARLKGDADQLGGGVLPASRRNLNAIVRTGVQAVSAKATMDTYQRNSDVITALVQISTLDARTTKTCMGYSGKRWDVVTKEPIGHDLPFVNDSGAATGTPRHWGCRSKISMQPKSFRELGLDVNDFKPSVRASMDGEVPADIGFEDFLKKKGKAFTEDRLGPGRAELYFEKKLTLSQLLDPQSGRELTLAELKAKYADKTIFKQPQGI